MASKWAFFLSNKYYFFVSHLASLIGVARIGNQTRFQTAKLVKRENAYEVLWSKCSGRYRNQKKMKLIFIGTDQKREKAYHLLLSHVLPLFLLSSSFAFSLKEFSPNSLWIYHLLTKYRINICHHVKWDNSVYKNITKLDV